MRRCSYSVIVCLKQQKNLFSPFPSYSWGERGCLPVGRVGANLAAGFILNLTGFCMGGKDGNGIDHAWSSKQ